MIRRPLRLFALTLPLLLAACGGSVPGTNTGGTSGNSAPEATILSAGGTKLNGTVVVSPNAQFTLNVSDSDSSVTRVDWTVTRGGTVVATGQFGAGEVKARLPLALPALPGGAYVLTVKATDDDGLTATSSANFVVDATAPRLSTVTLNGAALTDGATTSVKVGAVASLVATATDELGGATVLVYQGNTLIAQGTGTVTIDLAGSAAGSANYKVVAVDGVGNTTVHTFTVNYEATTGETPAPSPILQINNRGDGPYSNVLSVTVSAGVAAGVGVKQVILEVTDANGIVDTTSYVSSSENATFNIDTTKYPDGDLRLRVIAIDATGQRGVSATRTVQVQNLVAPTLTFVTPSNGADVTGVSTVVLQLRQNNTDFTFTSATENVVLEIIDSRGQLVTTQTATFVRVNEGLYQANTTVDFNATQYLNGTYTLRARTSVRLAGETTDRPLSTEISINNRSRIDEAPALNILLPAFFDANASQRPVLTRKSAVAVQVSDSDAIQQLQLRFTCDAATKLPTQTCNTSAYNFNLPVGGPGLYYRVFNTGVLVDGQPFVPDGNYVMRVTATDVAGNSNIKEMNVLVDRSRAGIANLNGTTTQTFEAAESKFTPASALWQVNGTTLNPTRIVTLYYSSLAEGLSLEQPSLIGIDTYAAPGTTITNGESFNAAGTFRTSFLVQDMVTGVVELYNGGNVNVATKQEE